MLKAFDSYCSEDPVSTLDNELSWNFYENSAPQRTAEKSASYQFVCRAANGAVSRTGLSCFVWRILLKSPIRPMLRIA